MARHTRAHARPRRTGSGTRTDTRTQKEKQGRPGHHHLAARLGAPKHQHQHQPSRRLFGVPPSHTGSPAPQRSRMRRPARVARERERGARARAPGGGPRARWLAWCPPRENPQFPPAQTELTQMPSSSRALTGQSQTARDLGSARPKKKTLLEVSPPRARRMGLIHSSGKAHRHHGPKLTD